MNAWPLTGPGTLLISPSPSLRTSQTSACFAASSRMGQA